MHISGLVFTSHLLRHHWTCLTSGLFITLWGGGTLKYFGTKARHVLAITFLRSALGYSTRTFSLYWLTDWGSNLGGYTLRLCLFLALQLLRTLVDFSGRAIAQAVSRRLPTAAAQVQTRVWSCGILWWTKGALGQVFSENFGFSCQSTFHLLLHNHLHYHLRLAQ
jgi:hypothetical protein